MPDPVPEEIMREARAAADEHDRRMRAMYLPHAGDRRTALIDIVATALMAERERAAEIAQSLGRHLRKGQSGPEYVCGNEAVATAILTYDRSTLKESPQDA